MASSVLAFIAAIKAEVSNSANSKVDSQLRLALVHALSRVSSIRSTWNEGSTTFNSSAGVSDYTSATSGFPKDASEIDLVEVQVQAGSVLYEEVRPGTLLDVREVLRSAQGNGSPYPDIFCWYSRSLMFAPAFTATRTVKVFYNRDARRDAATGNLIDATAGSDAYVNDWLLSGEDLLWAKTLEIYHARFAVDDQRLTYYARQFSQALVGVQAEWVRKASGGGFACEPYL